MSFNPQFSVDDLRTPESLERVLRQFQLAIIPKTQPPTDPALLAAQLAPFIRDALQATGSAPLNLQSLLPSSNIGIPIADTHANRLTLYQPYRFPPGQLYYETDRGVWYMVVSTLNILSWSYVGGIYDAALASIPADLAANDNGFLFEVTDYDHVLQWSGSVWDWGPGDEGSGYYRLYESAPNSSGASAWQLCNGSTVNRLNANASVTSVTVPDVTTAVYLKAGLAAAAIAAASGTLANTTATNQATDLSPATDTFTNLIGGGAAIVSITNPHNHTQDAHNHAAGTLELRNKLTALYYRR